MMLRSAALTAFAVMLIAGAPAALPQWSPNEDIVDHVEKQPDHKVFAAALKASGLRARLKGPGRFTVLAPNDAAFAQLPKGMMAALLANSSRQAQLRQLIGCHVIAREIKFGVFEPIDPGPVTTLGGCKLRFSRKGSEVYVADENGLVAHLVRFDVFEANGQFEELDAVLTPRLSSITKPATK